MFGGLIYIHYLCIDNVREMSGWGRNTSWSVDSTLLLYIIIDPPSFVRDLVVYMKYYYYICTMKNLLILMFLPLFSVGISMMISRPVPCEPLVSVIEGRRYV